MCGICGVVVPAGIDRAVDPDSLRQMRDALEHRGPDDAGIYIDRGVGLGHRRLSIVDVGSGHQPMSNEDSTVWISYNGEVYNHRDLRPALEAAGHRYRTACDTETIIHLYEEQGPRAVEQLRGMFAFAIWDGPRQRLVLARDRLGIKPLYYAQNEDGTLWFASEIKSLLAAGALRAELNYNALPDYLANRGVSGDETLFAGVRRLPPGHILIWENGRIEIERYWTLSFERPGPDGRDPGQDGRDPGQDGRDPGQDGRDNDSPRPEAEYVEQFVELFDESVRLRLMADVPLGMFLSGGIDSSAIVASMSRFVDEPIKTFSVAFAEREANELAYARLVASQFGTDHHEVVVSPGQFADALPQLVYQEDEPIAHPSSIPLFFVSRLAAEQVKVVLTGEGSDELLGGYDKYRKTLYNLALGRVYHSAAPSVLREKIAAAIGRLNGSSLLRRKLSRTFLCLEPRIDEIYFDNFSVFSRNAQTRIFTAGTRDQINDLDPYRRMREAIVSSDARSMLNQLLAADLKTYLHELLMKQDQMSMSASIESRVPFLDHKLVEFVARLPERMKLRGLKTKYVLRRAMESRLPRQILTRRKMGFPVPFGAWLRGPLSYIVDEYITSTRAAARGIFDPIFVKELAQRHRAGEDHSERLWALANFEIWQRRFFDREPVTEENEMAWRAAAPVAI
jgi:asparagine synthase (glutamine-hydrolysing)